MNSERIQIPTLLAKVKTAQEAAALIEDGMVVGSSGFTRAGDSKAVLQALAERAQSNPLKITLLTGASLGHDTDGLLAESHALYKRMPFQSDNGLRSHINDGEVLFIDQHLGETAELLQAENIRPVDLAVIEVAMIRADGQLIPTTSVGNSATFVQQAKQLIIEVNMAVPTSIAGIHDIHIPERYPFRKPILIEKVDDRIGSIGIEFDPAKVVAVVFTNLSDSAATIAPPEAKTDAIAAHLIEFFEKEVHKGKLSYHLLPLQAGIGKVANAILQGFVNSPFEGLTMYSEVLQDSTFELIDAGKMDFASASSITVSKEWYQKLFINFERYKDKILLRPQNISNAAEVIRRLGVIAINTAIEFDIYGNVNSTHIYGTKMMNGIGGSGDFARNAYLSIFVCQAASKNDTISHVVPMVAHVDHTEHDVDILVTDFGLADLRGLAPRERAKVIIENCAHPDYREALLDYYTRALEKGGQTPHLLGEALSWHERLQKTGRMTSELERVASIQ